VEDARRRQETHDRLVTDGSNTAGAASIGAVTLAIAGDGTYQGGITFVNRIWAANHLRGVPQRLFDEIYKGTFSPVNIARLRTMLSRDNTVTQMILNDKGVFEKSQQEGTLGENTRSAWLQGFNNYV
jgi:hypothetical protein